MDFASDFCLNGSSFASVDLIVDIIFIDMQEKTTPVMSKRMPNVG